MTTRSLPPSAEAPDTIQAWIRIPAAETVYVNAILESYEGVCVLSGDGSGGDDRLLLLIPRGQEGLVRQILGACELAEGTIEYIDE